MLSGGGRDQCHAELRQRCLALDQGMNFDLAGKAGRMSGGDL